MLQTWSESTNNNPLEMLFKNNILLHLNGSIVKSLSMIFASFDKYVHWRCRIHMEMCHWIVIKFISVEKLFGNTLGECLVWQLYRPFSQNGGDFNILLSTFKLALLASFRVTYSFESLIQDWRFNSRTRPVGLIWMKTI